MAHVPGDAVSTLVFMLPDKGRFEGEGAQGCASLSPKQTCARVHSPISKGCLYSQFGWLGSCLGRLVITKLLASCSLSSVTDWDWLCRKKGGWGLGESAVGSGEGSWWAQVHGTEQDCGYKASGLFTTLKFHSFFLKEIDSEVHFWSLSEMAWLRICRDQVLVDMCLQSWIEDKGFHLTGCWEHWFLPTLVDGLEEGAHGARTDPFCTLRFAL